MRELEILRVQSFSGLATTDARRVLGLMGDGRGEKPLLDRATLAGRLSPPS